MIPRARTYLAGPGLGPLLIKATFGSAGLRIIGMFFGFLVGVQLARGLGVEGYGIYGLAMSIIALLSVPAEFGLPQLLTREVAAAQVEKDWGRLSGILKWSTQTVLLISAAITVVVVGWLAATGQDLNSSLTMTMLTGLVMVPLVGIGNLYSAALRGLQHIVKGQINILLRPASYSLLLFFIPLLITPLNPALAMGLGAASTAIALLVATIMLRRNLPHEVHIAPSIIQSRTWWASALPMALTEGMRVLQGHLAILLMGIIATVSMVGIFRVASSIALLVALPVTLFNVVIAPIIARLHAQGDHARLQRILTWTALAMTSSTFALTLPFMLAGDSLLSIFFGEEFRAANVPLLVLCVSAVINGLFGTNAALLNMTGHQARVTRASGISLALLACVSAPLIALQGALGAAIGIAFSMLAWNLLMWHDAERLLLLDTSLVSFLRTPQSHG
jgi:O-antigen/teichoic acid export membrane protein